MRLQPVLIGLTALNVVMFGAVLMRPALAAPANDGMLRGRGPRIVDAQGKVRASIQVLAASRQKDGTMSAETVLLRLITEKGRPAVKIATSEEQSGMSLVGPTGASNTYITTFAGSETSSVVVKNENGAEQKISP